MIILEVGSDVKLHTHVCTPAIFIALSYPMRRRSHAATTQACLENCSFTSLPTSKMITVYAGIFCRPTVGESGVGWNIFHKNDSIMQIKLIHYLRTRPISVKAHICVLQIYHIKFVDLFMLI